MKKYLILFLIIISFFCFNVKADTYQVTLTGNNVSLRSGPGTNYDKVGNLLINTSYIMSENKIYTSEKGCSDGWYKITYNGSEGYFCSSYGTVKVIKDEDLSSCEDKLKALGFPDSYVSGLCILQNAHPSWSFVPLITNLDWNEAVNKESECGQSYVYTSDSEYIDTSCTNVYAGKVSNLYPASKTAVAYYMDPRNFFTEKYIFQFENLKYTSSLHDYYPSAISYVLRNAQFYKYHVNIGNDFSGIVNNACSKTDVNINPVFLSARMLQELGTKDSEYNLYSGIYTGYEGYYNFFNYGVSDSCATTYGSTVCGLEYAKNNGWNSLENAISGGASKIASNYVAQNQNTNYLQKFNVTPLNSNKLYVHQYMTNIGAPSSESITSFNTYNENSLLNSPFVFYIPVYNNMDDGVSNSNSGGSNESSDNTVSTLDIATIISSSGYKTSGEYFKGVGPLTDASSIISSVTSIGGKVSIKNASGTEITSGTVGTGYTISVSNNVSTNNYTIVVNGDTNGDGKISAVDLLYVQKVLLGTYNLTGAYADAGDTSDDGKISAVDLLQVQKVLLGTYTIVQ